MKNSFKNRMRCLLCLLTVCACFLSGCARTSPPSLSRIRERDFSAEVSGVMNGQELHLYLTVTGTEETAKKVRLEYLSPPGLNGVTVTAHLDPDTVTDRIGAVTFPTCSDVRITYQGHSHTLPSGALDGLLLPASLLLSLNTPATVQRGNDTYTLTFENGVVLVLSPDGTPLSLASPALSVTFAPPAVGLFSSRAADGFGLFARV